MTHNNDIKPFALAIVIVSAFLLVALIAFGWMNYNKAPETEYSVYPLTVRVIDLDHDADVVVCVDGAGNGWEFYGVEDWQVGNFASLLMNNNGTPETIYDDIIIMTHYAGIFEG